MNVVLLCNSSLNVHLLENYYKNYNGKLINISNMEYSVLSCMLSEEWLKLNKIDLLVTIGNSYQNCDFLFNLMNSSSIPIFMPNKKSSRLEQSKIFTKILLKKLNIPTADFNIIKGKYIKNQKPPFVIKYNLDKLMGKQTEIVLDDSYHFSARNEFMNKDVLIENFLIGDEFSYQVICNGSSFIFFGISKDYKKYKEFNTCGIASTSDSIQENIPEIDLYIQKILDFMLSIGIEYKGIIYLNIMKVDTLYYVLEINTRFGEPETQSLYPTLSTNLFEMFYSAARGQKLSKIERTKNAGACVQLIHKDYDETRKENCSFPDLTWSKEIMFGSQLNWSKNNVFGSLTASGKTINDAVQKIHKYIEDKNLGDYTYKKL